MSKQILLETLSTLLPGDAIIEGVTLAFRRSNPHECDVDVAGSIIDQLVRAGVFGINVELNLGMRRHGNIIELSIAKA